jgi:hypothetical protein
VGSAAGGSTTAIRVSTTSAAKELGSTEIKARHDRAIRSFFKENLPSLLTNPRITFPEKSIINTV